MCKYNIGTFDAIFVCITLAIDDKLFSLTCIVFGLVFVGGVLWYILVHFYYFPPVSVTIFQVIIFREVSQAKLFKSFLSHPFLFII
jgi:hypothetical protein